MSHKRVFIVGGHLHHSHNDRLPDTYNCSMRRKILVSLFVSIIFLCLCAPGAYVMFRRGPVYDAGQMVRLFEGVEYERIEWSSPRPVVIHVATIDLQTAGIRVLVTPGDPDAELPLEGRTTSAFLNDYGLQLAINGDFFQPWHSRGLLDYYPHVGDLVEPLGYAAGGGETYSDYTTKAASTLYFSPTNAARFNQPLNNVENAVSGYPLLVRNGSVEAALNDTDVGPRTMSALTQSRRYLILIVVDGRQPGYSEGVTLRELAQIAIEHGAHFAMNMDGGGSSTMVMEGGLGQAVQLNRPVNHGIPGRERVVANHLGIFAKP